MNFLPVSKQDMIDRGIEQLDFIVLTGDAYVDHPSFGTAIITRILEDKGYTVGIIARPDISKDKDFTVLGRPRLGFMIASGNIDSMVLNYTVAKKRRTDDFYAPKGYKAQRPDRALTVYTKRIRDIYGDVPIIIGGIEASLRRFAHYDYWADTVLPSVLIDSGADLLVYGMGENQTIEIAKRLNSGDAINSITDIKGTCYLTDNILGEKGLRIHSYNQVKEDKAMYATSCKAQYDEQDFVTGKTLFQEHDGRFLVQNPPMPPLNREELDHVYSLPFMRTYHPMYEPLGGVDAIKEVQFSITHNRGCFSACNFCALSFHQGRAVTSRSEQSVVDEAKQLINHKDFKGYIHDVGGPTANFRQPSCKKQLKSGLCKNKRCLAPSQCKNLEVDHSEYLGILRKLRSLKGVKRVFVRSGIRFDYLLADSDKTFFKELVEHHISGQLKVAPEHCSASVLELMGKPYIQSYKDFSKQFYSITKQANKEQYLIPYLMSSHPGSTIKSAIELALFLKSENIRPQQVQDFYPTPGTISTCMYYTGLNPYTMKKVYITISPHEKAMQRALLQYFLPQNRRLVIEALKTANRLDLIGNDKSCLIKPASDTKMLLQSNTAKPDKTKKKDIRTKSFKRRER